MLALATVFNLCAHLFNRGNKVFELPRFMSASDAAIQLLDIIRRRENDGLPLKGKAIVSTF